MGIKGQVDKRRENVSFAIGKWVFVKLRPHVQHFVEARINLKLSSRYYGLFEIVTKVGAVAYRLQLPTIICIHAIFHVSLLKKATKKLTYGNCTLNVTFPNMWEPVAMLVSRTITQVGFDVKYWLI